MLASLLNNPEFEATVEEVERQGFSARWHRLRGVGGKTLKRLLDMGVAKDYFDAYAPFPIASTRLKSVLNNANINSKEQAEKLLLSGKIWRYRNCGRESVRELAALLGYVLQDKCTCPTCGQTVPASKKVKTASTTQDTQARPARPACEP